jgi:hypothetical protein
VSGDAVQAGRSNGAGALGGIGTATPAPLSAAWLAAAADDPAATLDQHRTQPTPYYVGIADRRSARGPAGLQSAVRGSAVPKGAPRVGARTAPAAAATPMHEIHHLCRRGADRAERSHVDGVLPTQGSKGNTLVWQ